MAIWETTAPSTTWLPMNIFDGQLSESSDKIVKIDNGEDDDTIEVGDDITLSFEGETNTLGGKFLGTVTVDGVVYPVVEIHLGSIRSRMIAGLDKSKTSTGKLADSALNESTFTVCFFPATLVATPSGERKVEELASGDLVLIGDSGAIPASWLGSKLARAVSVKWIGRQTVSTLFGPAERLMPVRFTAGSLGGGGQLFQPNSDLTVTADHAMLVDGVLCEAGALVNGTTITRVPLSEFGESYTVYHVETEAHEIILANGAPSETFVDNISRHAFDNYAEFEAVHDENSTEMVELHYPRASNARHLPARIKRRLGIGVAEKPGRVA